MSRPVTGAGSTVVAIVGEAFAAVRAERDQALELLARVVACAEPSGSDGWQVAQVSPALVAEISGLLGRT